MSFQPHQIYIDSICKIHLYDTKKDLIYKYNNVESTVIADIEDFMEHHKDKPNFYTEDTTYTIQIYYPEMQFVPEKVPLHHALFNHIQKLLEHAGCQCNCKKYTEKHNPQLKYMKSLFQLRSRLNALHYMENSNPFKTVNLGAKKAAQKQVSNSTENRVTIDYRREFVTFKAQGTGRKLLRMQMGWDVSRVVRAKPRECVIVGKGCFPRGEQIYFSIVFEVPYVKVYQIPSSSNYTTHLDVLCQDKDPKNVLEELDAMFDKARLCYVLQDDDDAPPNRSNWKLDDLISIIDYTVRQCRKRSIKTAAYGWSLEAAEECGEYVGKGTYSSGETIPLVIQLHFPEIMVFQKKPGSIPPEPDVLIASAMYAEELISSLDKHFMQKSPTFTSSHRAVAQYR